jgi:phosphodiesterase/alkaline phosphatase D-like protein
MTTINRRTLLRAGLAGGAAGAILGTRRHPDFMLHSGDTVYADGPRPATVTLPDGNITLHP